MSLGSWYIILTKLIEQRRLNRSADAAAKTFWTAGTLQDGVGTLKAKAAPSASSPRAARRPRSTTRARSSS